MQTNFFELFASLNIKADMMIVVRDTGNGEMMVSISLSTKNVPDKAANNIKPFSLRGTVAELNQSFFERITTPMQKTDALFTNMTDYEKALEQAREKSKMEKQQQDNTAKEKTEKQKKYDAAMSKVAELEKKQKYGEAIAALPKPEDYPEQKEQIEAKKKELWKMKGEPDLFA